MTKLDIFSTWASPGGYEGSGEIYCKLFCCYADSALAIRRSGHYESSGARRAFVQLYEFDRH
jgi:hypothetical protein